MVREEAALSFFAKAEEELQAAASELEGGRYNTCAKLAYFACFHAAVALLLRGGLPLPRGNGVWGHDYVQAEFARRSLQVHKQYPAEFRDVLPRGFSLRQVADYRTARVSGTLAARFLR